MKYSQCKSLEKARAVFHKPKYISKSTRITNSLFYNKLALQRDIALQGDQQWVHIGSVAIDCFPLLAREEFWKTTVR